jgi:transcriptional regulator NrdR family protein
MQCPKCGKDSSGIFDSRKRVDHVWRRRRCYECNFPWETMEIDKEVYVTLQQALARYTRERKDR